MLFVVGRSTLRGRTKLPRRVAQRRAPRSGCTCGPDDPRAVAICRHPTEDRRSLAPPRNGLRGRRSLRGRTDARCGASERNRRCTEALDASYVADERSRQRMTVPAPPRRDERGGSHRSPAVRCRLWCSVPDCDSGRSSCTRRYLRAQRPSHAGRREVVERGCQPPVRCDAFGEDLVAVSSLAPTSTSGAACVAAPPLWLGLVLAKLDGSFSARAPPARARGIATADERAAPRHGQRARAGLSTRARVTSSYGDVLHENAPARPRRQRRMSRCSTSRADDQTNSRWEQTGEVAWDGTAK